MGHLGILLTVAVACTVAHARRSVQLDDNRLIVRSTFFTKRVPLRALRLDSARIVDLAEHTAFKPACSCSALVIRDSNRGITAANPQPEAFIC